MFKACTVAELFARLSAWIIGLNRHCSPNISENYECLGTSKYAILELNMN